MEYPLFFTGNAYDLLAKMNPGIINCIITTNSHFRTYISDAKKNQFCQIKIPPPSLHTLMCGDGTNDVGALKQSHIGVALLDGRPEDLPKILKEMRDSQIVNINKAMLETRKSGKVPLL